MESPAYISSSGEMKMSLKEMTYVVLDVVPLIHIGQTNILVLEMLEQLQLSVCTLRQHRRAKGLHDLLDRNILTGELIFG
jgi:hypothetical protein